MSVYGFGRDNARLLLKVARREGLSSGGDGGLSYPDSGSVPGIPFKNNNAGTVPAWGVMRITGRTAKTSTAAGFLTTDQPTATYRWVYLVNGPDDIASGAYGYGSFLTDPFLAEEDHAQVLYDTGATPAYGERWGPIASSGLLGQHRPGFFIFGGTAGSGSTSRVAAMQIPPGEVRVKNDDGGGTLAAGGSGRTFGIYAGSAGTTDTGLEVTLTNGSSTAWTANKYGFATADNGGVIFGAPHQT